MTINGKSVYAVLGLWTRVRSSRFQDWSLYWISVGFPPYILQGQETGSNQFWILLTKLCFQDVTKFALFPFVKYLLSFHKIVCPPVRPDLAKFCHFGKRIKELFVGIWQNFEPTFGFILLLGKCCKMAKYWTSNLAIWSHVIAHKYWTFFGLSVNFLTLLDHTF